LERLTILHWGSEADCRQLSGETGRKAVIGADAIDPNAEVTSAFDGRYRTALYWITIGRL
jgi:hypothetical protein